MGKSWFRFKVAFVELNGVSGLIWCVGDLSNTPVH